MPLHSYLSGIVDRSQKVTKGDISLNLIVHKKFASPSLCIMKKCTVLV